MLNCFSELPDLENPFKAEDIFVDEDWEIFENYKFDEMNLSAGNIQWFDANKDVAKVDPIAYDVSPPTESPDVFSGVGWVTNKKFARQLHEFANDCLPDGFIKEMWSTPTGQRLFPVTVLAWGRTNSDWHMEGCRYDWQKNTYLNDIRYSTVCNFKILGQDASSRIEYVEPSVRMIKVLEKLTDEFVNYKGKEDYTLMLQEISASIRTGTIDEKIRAMFVDPTEELSAEEERERNIKILEYQQKLKGKDLNYKQLVDDIEHNRGLAGDKPVVFKPRAVEKGLMVSGPNDVISPNGEKYWYDEFTPICTKQGYANPFIMNLQQWHKVYVGNDNSPRVTLRFMADRSIPFSHWEEMVDNGTFLK